MPWFDGMSFGQVHAALMTGRFAPAVEARGWVEVPPGFPAWCAQNGIAKPEVFHPLPRCRACGRPLTVDCCSAECQREPACEICLAQLAFLETQGRFLADLDRALALALPANRNSLADLQRMLLGPP